jgi:two-component system, NarL family, capsular synthesis sensor histidine kinase RcsC
MNSCDILIVDDDELYLGLVKRIVEGAGVKARYATSGEEAAGILKEGFFALLITDLQMPGMSGFELALTAKGLHPEIDVLMVTGSQAPGVQRLARQAGISKVMAKPVSAAKIREMVRHRPGAAQRGAADDRCTGAEGTP